MSPYTNELQLVNGKFITKSYSGVLDGGYKNYTTDGITGGPNYSDISGNGYRWATFRWKITGNNITKLSIQISGIKNGANQDIIFYNKVAGGGGVTIGQTGPEFKVYYRIADENDVNGGKPTGKLDDNSKSSKFSTVWINANKVAPTTFGAQATGIGENGTQSFSSNDLGGTSSASIIDIPQITEQVLIPPARNSIIYGNTTNGLAILSLSGTYYLYVTVGLPMNNDISFSSISCVTA
jgi:hypothetical protein